MESKHAKDRISHSKICFLQNKKKLRKLAKSEKQLVLRCERSNITIEPTNTEKP
jgi:hypothetical protein